MSLEYKYINKANIVNIAFKLINDNNEEIYVSIYNNGDNILYNNVVYLNKFIFYNFKKDTKKIRILIHFRKTEFNAEANAWYTPANSNRVIIKHIGN